jgi:Skp family chaperone for outer membrane proteins
MSYKTRWLPIVALAIAIGFTGKAWAELQVGTVDLQRVRTESPQFKKALASVDAMTSRFEKERDDRKSELDKLSADLRDAQSRGFKGTTDRMQADLQDKSQAFQQFMQETFGTDGIIEKNSSEQLKPLYDKLAQAAKNVATAKGLDLILDLEQVNPLFSSDRLDVTDAILAEMAQLR